MNTKYTINNYIFKNFKKQHFNSCDENYDKALRIPRISKNITNFFTILTYSKVKLNYILNNYKRNIIVCTTVISSIIKFRTTCSLK